MLSKYEKETIYRTSEGDTTVTLETFNPVLKRRLAKLAVAYPDCARLIRSTQEGSVTYEVDKPCATIRFNPPYSDDRKRAARENGKKNGFQPEDTVTK